MIAQKFISKLRSEGRYSLTVSETEKAFGLSKIPALNALRRLKQNKLLVSPAKRFYLIIPPEYQSFGCLPVDMFINELMKFFNQPYYVGFLSAAQLYGAAHQKPQRFQVVTQKNRRPIYCGRISIEFIANKNVALIPTKKFNTQTGTIVVATPEVIALDLVTAPQHAAGISNVATVLTELAEQMSSERILALSRIHKEIFWVQRLGFLLESLGFDLLANTLAQILKNKKLHWVCLVSRADYKPISRNNKWKIIINTEVETE